MTFTAVPLVVTANADAGAVVELKLSSYVRTISVPDGWTTELTKIGP